MIEPHVMASIRDMDAATEPRNTAQYHRRLLLQDHDRLTRELASARAEIAAAKAVVAVAT